MTVGKVHLTKRYARYRIREPSRFKKNSLRTQPLGRRTKLRTKRIAGRLKKTGRWATQAILIPRSRYEKGERMKMVHGRPVITHSLRKFME